MNETKMGIDYNLHEDKSHGSLEYPVDVYSIDLEKITMGHVHWHWHEEIEIALVLHGQAEFSVDEKVFVLKEGACILFNQNILHSIHPVKDKKCILQVIVFHPSYLFGYKENYLYNKYLTPIVDAFSMKYLLIQDINTFNNKMKKIINQIIADNLVKKFGYELSTKSQLCKLWLLLLNHLSSPNRKTFDNATSLTSDGARTKQGLMYIQENYANTITLDSLAEAIHISKSECCRLFKRSLNLTPFEYIIKYRIYMSTRLMLQDNPKFDSISDLALSVGFNTTSYYNKWFKYYLKCTPSQYKRSIQSGNATNPDFMDSLPEI
ncbi:MAG TPA: AraC family transcriptional regulator [Lachnospiraceae bacterium]|nr:AraC family transcriptional regulator [Lachnospiraceae bacterium]